MKVELSKEEIDFIQQVLGELPSKTGAFLVMNSIAKQVAEQAETKPEIPKLNEV